MTLLLLFIPIVAIGIIDFMYIVIMTHLNAAVLKNHVRISLSRLFGHKNNYDNNYDIDIFCTCVYITHTACVVICDRRATI